MDTTIYDLMSSSEKKIDEFKTACDNFRSSQYILADIKITALLESIAISKTLYELFNEILVDFDYKETARNFMTNNFKLPEDPKIISALVFCILLDMDKKNIDLNDFLTIMSKGDINYNYETFLEKIILPFKTSVLYLLSMKKNRVDEKQAIIKELNLEENQRISFEKRMRTFFARIQSDDKMNIIEKDKILSLGNVLLIAKETDDERQLQKVYAKLYKKIRLYKPSLLNEFENLI